MTIQFGSVTHANSLAQLLQKVFTQTYAAAIPPDTLRRYLNQEFSPAALALKLADPYAVSLIAEVNGEVIACSRVEPQPLPHQPQQAGTAELTKLYVDADFHGRGIAAKVMERTEAAAQERGWHTLWLCVWEHNPRAISFYRKHGFAEVGHTEVHVEDIVFHDLVMTKELND